MPIYMIIEASLQVLKLKEETSCSLLLAPAQLESEPASSSLLSPSSLPLHLELVAKYTVLHINTLI